MEIPTDLTRRIDGWAGLSRWERSEIGRDLRRLGLSFGEIRALIEVKKSTLSNWCRDIELTESQKQAILARTGSRKGIPGDTNWRRRLEVDRIRSDARTEAISRLGEPMWLAGVILYWAEGSKTRNHLELANSDPDALRLFVAWLRRYLSEDVEFVMQMHLHEGNDEEAAKQYWRREVGLPDGPFHKTFIKPAGTGHRKNHLAHGVCRVRVRAAANHWQRVMGWVEEVASTLPDLMSV